MIIGVDGNEANVNYRVGVSNYSFQLLSYFRKKADENIRFLVFLREKPKDDMPKENRFFKYQVVWGKFLWSQVFLPLSLLKKRVDVFFSMAHYAPRFIKAPYVVTIHDLSFFRYPEDFRKRDLLKLFFFTNYSIKKAQKVIAVSQATKKDILKIYQLPDDRIKVIYNGFEKSKSSGGRFLRHIPKRYFLYVGTLQPRKNLSTLINAYNQLQNKYPQFELVIAGKKGWLYESLFKQVSDLGLSEKIFFTDYVKDKQLEFLYRHAFAFVLPSLYEGFGIPILEAMSFNCPVIASHSSSLPEIGDNACLYFNPLDEKDLVKNMEILIKDSALRKELVKKGKQRIKEFSWQKCANQTLELLIQVARNES